MSRFASIRPKAMAQETALSPIAVTQITPGQSLPVVVQANGAGSITTWARSHQLDIADWLRVQGGVLFRGFPVNSMEDFEQFVRSISPDLIEYKERSTPRTEVGNRIYTSTEYPASQRIALHNEFSYSYTWPMRIFFYANEVAQTGGETPIADSRGIYRNMPTVLRDKFAELGVLYVRNYGNGIDIPWQSSFQTDDRAAVEDYCRGAQVDWEWLSGDRLRTRQRRPAVARHPVTDEMVWFNQANLFHVSNLGDEAAEAMQRVFAREDLPRNAYFGDGRDITPEELNTVRSAIDSATTSFPWHRGDVLMLDNMLVAHGRSSYTGQRKVLAALAEPFTVSPIDWASMRRTTESQA